MASPLNKNQRWNMPARNYVRHLVPASYAPRNITMVFFDSNACLKDFVQTEDPSKWKPKNSDDDPKYNFNGNIRAAPCDSDWLHAALKIASKHDWLLVVAHEPAYAVDMFDMVSMLEKYSVDLYLHGHEHRLTH